MTGTVVPLLSLLAATTGCGDGRVGGGDAATGAGGAPAVDGAAGADGAAGGALSGMVSGRPFVVRDAVIATTLSWKSSLYPGDSTVIILSDHAGLCNQIQTNLTRPDTQLVILDVGEAGAGTVRPVTGPGTFPLSGDLSQPRAAFAVYTHVDAQCAFADLGATAGSVTLTELGPNAASARGSFAAAFEGAASLSGDFEVAHGCPTAAVDVYLNQNPTCP